MSARRFLTEKEHYDAFVQASLSELQYGLDIDGTTSKRDASSVVQEVMTSTSEELKDNSGARVLCARFALGGDDAAYLQSGLAVLWSTVAHKGRNDDLALAPAALYSPDAVGGIRRGLLRALEAKHKEMEENAEDNLRVLMNALKGVLDVPQLQTYADELRALLDAKEVDYVALAQALCDLKKVLDGDGNDTDLAASILDRVDCLNKLVKTREQLKLTEKRCVAEANVFEGALKDAEDSEAAAKKMAGEKAAAAEAANQKANQKIIEAAAAKAEAKRQAFAAELAQAVSASKDAEIEKARRKSHSWKRRS